MNDSQRLANEIREMVKEKDITIPGSPATPASQATRSAQASEEGNTVRATADIQANQGPNLRSLSIDRA